MTCKRCGWPTSLWNRGLGNGLCAECRKIDRASPGLEAPVVVRQALSAHAARYLEDGGTLAGLERNLLASGLQPQEATAVVQDIVSQRVAYTTALDLLDQGAGVLDVRRKLVESGLTSEATAAIVEEAQEARSGVRSYGSLCRRRSTDITPAQRALMTAGVVIFTVIFIIGCLVSFQAGSLVAVGYWLSQLGQIWLLVLVARECPPDAIICALVIPFFTWYFAYQRWDIAKWAFLCNLGGLLLLLLGLCSGA